VHKQFSKKDLARTMSTEGSIKGKLDLFKTMTSSKSIMKSIVR
jgi:hypothetical protein